jgi:hypothetical protein
MASTPSTGTSSHRNRTVVTALWVLAVVAVIEIILAAIALAPRLVSGMRTGIVSAASPSPATLQGSPLPQQASALPLPAGALPSQGMTDQQKTLGPTTPPPDAMPSGGPSLLIVNAKLLGGEDGSKKLQVSIKSNTRDLIDVQQVKVQVYFYDQDNGEIVPSKAQVTSAWLSPPVDWKKGTPELLEVQYSPDNSSSEVSFAGYLIAIYYKGDLQDCRAEPSRLKKLFEPKYFIGTEE